MKSFATTLLAALCIYARATPPQDIDERSNMRAMNTSSRKLSMSNQCSENLNTVAKVGSMADVGEIGMACTTEKSERYTHDTCDSTGTSAANAIIKHCRSVGGKPITVLFTNTCRIFDAVRTETTDIEDMIGPLCLPTKCGVEEYIDYRNTISSGFDLGGAGRCDPTISSFDSFNYLYFGLLLGGTLVVMSGVVLMYWCSKRNSDREDLRNLVTSTEMS